MSNAEGLLGSQFDWSPGTARLAIGDMLVILGFLVVGALRHGVNPVESPLAVADIVAPFLVGWVVAALVAGAYAPGATRTVERAVIVAVATWIPAAAIGLTLRATGFFQGNSPLAFVLVITGVGVVSLAAWRATVAALR